MKFRQIYRATAVITVFGIAGYLFAPFYVFLAEDNPALLPFGWKTIPANAPYAEGPVAAQYLEKADELHKLLVAHHAQIGVPAFSAAVTVEGELVWSAAVGWADLKSLRPATPQTLFRIGSTSKAVTGTLFARLLDVGEVELDVPIKEYSRTLPNSAWGKLTLRQLASHTAGIPSYEKNRDYLGAYQSLYPTEHHSNVREGLEYFDGSPLIFEPGTDFEYSSYDTVLQSFVLQEAVSKSYQALLQEWIAEPLDIQSPRPDMHTPDRAEFYLLKDGEAHTFFDVDVSHRMAGGGLMARPSDMAVLGGAWLDESFISAKTRERFWEPQRLKDGSVNEQNYAVNWRAHERISRDMDGFNVNHGGVGKGAMSWLIIIPEKKMAISLMINGRVWPFRKWSKVQDDLVRIFSRD